jgi:hypothetical protein
MATTGTPRGRVFGGAAWKATVDLATQLDSDTLSGRDLDRQLARRLARVIILLDEEGTSGAETLSTRT